MSNDAQQKNNDVPWSWRVWIHTVEVVLVLSALFVIAVIVWFLARPIGHVAADTVQRWDTGWQEGLNDGPD